MASRENTSGLGVNKNYNATDTGQGVGVNKTEGYWNEVVYQCGPESEALGFFFLDLPKQVTIDTVGYFDTNSANTAKVVIDVFVDDVVTDSEALDLGGAITEGTFDLTAINNTYAGASSVKLRFSVIGNTADAYEPGEFTKLTIRYRNSIATYS